MKVNKEIIIRIAVTVFIFVLANVLLLVPIFAMRDVGYSEFQIGLWTVVTAFILAYGLTDCLLDIPVTKGFKIVKEKVRGKHASHADRKTTKVCR